MGIDGIVGHHAHPTCKGRAESSQVLRGLPLPSEERRNPDESRPWPRPQEADYGHLATPLFMSMLCLACHPKARIHLIERIILSARCRVPVSSLPPDDNEVAPTPSTS